MHSLQLASFFFLSQLRRTLLATVLAGAMSVSGTVQYSTARNGVIFQSSRRSARYQEEEACSHIHPTTSPFSLARPVRSSLLELSAGRNSQESLMIGKDQGRTRWRRRRAKIRAASPGSRGWLGSPRDSSFSLFCFLSLAQPPSSAIKSESYRYVIPSDGRCGCCVVCVFDALVSEVFLT